jgi:hypothetical protein
MSKLPQEENQLEKYRATFDEYQMDYDTMVDLFNDMTKNGYTSEAIVWEDEWRSNNREEIALIELGNKQFEYEV